MRNDKRFNEALEKIKMVFSRMNFKGKAFLFGSSVRDDYLKTSDIDIAVDCSEKRFVTFLRLEIEELDIPYKVELIDFTEASAALKEEIVTHGVLIWKN